MRKAPGKSHRGGITLMQLTAMFPDEESASAWFEEQVWPNGKRVCPRCKNRKTKATPNSKPMPYWCPSCRKHFSVRTATALERSHVSLRQWVFAIYSELTSLKGVSSMKLHRDIGVTQKTAWFMLHRIREAWKQETAQLFIGPVEADETYFGGKRKNMPKSKRKGLEGRGATGKVAVAGIKDRTTKRIRAKVVEKTDAKTLQGFVRGSVHVGAAVYTDDASAYHGLVDFEHKAVRHSIAEYVRGRVHTNGIESFWALLKRAHNGTYHKLSAKHLQRYVDTFAGRYSIRDMDTIDQMESVVTGLVGRRLMYRELTA